MALISGVRSDGGLNTYGYVGGNPVKYVDPFGLLVGDPSDWVVVESAVTTVTTGVAAALVGVASALYSSPAGEGSDQVPEQCKDDDKCKELYKRIDIAVNGLQRRHRQIRENKGGIDPGTHQEQFRGRQAYLRKLLFEANTKGCFNYRTDAWYWATRRTPVPMVR